MCRSIAWAKKNYARAQQNSPRSTKSIGDVLRRIIVSILLTVLSSHSQAMTFGDKACAEAKIIGSIENQTWESLRDDDPNVIIMDGLNHITFDVKRVVYGRISTGILNLISVQHTYFDDKLGDVTLMLRKDSRGTWWVAKCNSR